MKLSDLDERERSILRKKTTPYVETPQIDLLCPFIMVLLWDYRSHRVTETSPGSIGRY